MIKKLLPSIKRNILTFERADCPPPAPVSLAGHTDKLRNTLWFQPSGNFDLSVRKNQFFLKVLSIHFISTVNTANCMFQNWLDLDVMIHMTLLHALLCVNCAAPTWNPANINLLSSVNLTWTSPFRSCLGSRSDTVAYMKVSKLSHDRQSSEP